MANRFAAAALGGREERVTRVQLSPELSDWRGPVAVAQGGAAAGRVVAGGAVAGGAVAGGAVVGEAGRGPSLRALSCSGDFRGKKLVITGFLRAIMKRLWLSFHGD